MSPEQLLERLAQSGVIDDKILSKLRRQLDTPGKEVKPAQILKYLVKKEHITSSQAKKLLKEVEAAPKPVKHEEIEVVQAEADYDTDDLTADVEVVEAAPDHEVIVASPDAETEVSPEVEIDAGMTAYDPQPIAVPPAALADPFADPLAGGMEAAGAADPYQSGGHPTQESTVPVAFAGKKYKPDQWQTKWLYIGFGILGSLLIFGAVLYIAVGRQTAEDMYTAAIKSFDASTYTDAIAKIDEFLETFPDDEKAPTLKARRAQALVAQTFESKNWNETVKRAENHLPPLIDDETVDMSLIRDDLGVMLPKTALAITERALRQTTLADLEKELEIAQRAEALSGNPAYVPSSMRKRTPTIFQQIDDNVRLVRGMIQKENDYDKALVEIKGLSDRNETDNAFAVFQKLTRVYGDLKARDELQKLMMGVSTKERELVKPFSSDLLVSNDDIKSMLDSTVVLASKNGSAMAQLQGEIMPVFAHGVVYGVDVSDGTVVWRRFVGQQTRIAPVVIDADDLLVSDQRSHEVMRIRRKDNGVIWRLSVNEPFVPPAVSENGMVVTTVSGKVMKLEPTSGAVTASVQLPQGANVSALISGRDPYIYQTGLYSNIYVLSAEDLSCRDVYYLGHQKGAIEIPPVMWSGHLVVGVNGGSSCDVNVLRSKEDNGIELEPIQLFSRLTTAPVTEEFQRFGRRLMVASESGELQVLTIDTTNLESPVTKFVSEKIENRGGDRMQLLTRGSDIWIASKGINRLRLKTSGEISRETIVNPADKFIAPMSVFGDLLVHVRRRGGSGMVSVAGVDSKTLVERWRTDLGGVVASSPVSVGGGLMAFSSQGDMFKVEEGTEVASDRVKSSTIVENLVFNSAIKMADDQMVLVGPGDRKEILFADAGKFETKLVQLQAPADRLACEPISIGGDLIAPSKAGAVVRVDAKTGRMIGAPFQPPVRPGADFPWLKPTVVGDGVFAIANAPAEGTPSKFYVLDGRNAQTMPALAEKESEFAIRSPLASISSIVYAVVSGESGDGLVALDSANGLEQRASVALGAGYAAGPWTAGSQVIVQTDAEKLLGFDGQLNPKWTVELPTVKLAGPPQALNNSIMLTFENGAVQILNAENGQEIQTFSLGQPVAHSPLFANQKLYFGGMDGTVHVYSPNKN